MRSRFFWTPLASPKAPIAGGACPSMSDQWLEGRLWLHLVMMRQSRQMGVIPEGRPACMMVTLSQTWLERGKAPPGRGGA
jgi:hypothetical protein